jgi:hypothetical protein
MYRYFLEVKLNFGGLVDQGLIPGRRRDFFVLSTKTGLRVPPNILCSGYQRLERSYHEADLSPPFSVRVWNAWGFNYVLPRIVMALCLSAGIIFLSHFLSRHISEKEYISKFVYSIMKFPQGC